MANQPQKIWALGIIASSAVGFGLQSVVHQSRLYRIVTALLIAWMVPTTLDVLSITVSVSHLATAVALLTIAGNGFVARIRARKSDSQLTRLSTTVVKFVKEFSLVATSTVGVLAIGQFFAQFEYPQGIAFFGSIGWMSVLQIVTAGLAACAVGFRGSLESGKSTAESETDRLIIVIGSALITAAIMTGVMVQGLSDQVVIAIAVGLPVLVAATSLVAKNPAVKNALQLSATTLMTTHLMMRGYIHFASLWSGDLVFDLASLQWSAVLAVAAAVYWVVSIGQSKSFSRVMSYFASTFAVALAGHHFGFEFGYCLVLAPMVVGTAMRVFETLAQPGKQLSDAANGNSLTLTANALVLGSGISGVLLALSRWVSSEASGALMTIMFVQLVCLTVTSLLTKHPTWRATFRALIVATLGASLCVFDGWLSIDGWQRLELCSLLGGSILLALGHMTWMREDGQTDDAASISLLIGSLLVSVPLVMGLLVYRLGFASDPNWMQFHEITTIAAGLVLFGSGVLCRLRATTISGATLLGVYLVSLLTLIRWPDQLQSVSVMMMVGGGIFFATALLMSIYRDRLMSLPKRIREGEGVYQILKWR